MLMSPAQGSSRSLVLDVGEDRLVLTARPSLFHLDIFHPFLVDQENSVAQYNSSTQVQKISTLFLDPVTYRIVFDARCCFWDLYTSFLPSSATSNSELAEVSITLSVAMFLETAA